MTNQVKKTGQKGFRLEEALRTYFLQAEYFVIRNVPFRIDGNDLTDIDLWLYERPTGSARRRQIVDAKSKSRPKTVERLLWTKGLAEALGVDGAYVATTDTRPIIRQVARKLGVLLFDGNDLQRIQAGNREHSSDRIVDEELWRRVRSIDESRKNKEFQLHLEDAKASVIQDFGAGTVVRSLEAVAYFASQAVSAHPGSPAAELAGRLTYFSAALAAIGLDGVRLDATFGSREDIRGILTNSIRFGNPDRMAGLAKLRVATRLVRRFAEDGATIARAIEERAQKEYEGIPAEIIADEAVRMGGMKGSLFSVARKLEQASYLHACPNFDELCAVLKSFVGALLDFSRIERRPFAEAWMTGGMRPSGGTTESTESLFDAKR